MDDQTATEPRLGEGTSKSLDEHFDNLRKKILDQAANLAEQDERKDKIEPRDVWEAVKLYAPGDFVFPQKTILRPRSVVDVIFSWTPSITTVSALLAITFGVIGWRAGTGAGTAGASAFDIAKVFAGAIVGSAGVAVKSAVTRR